MVAATALKRVFAANRSAGRLALTVAAADGVTRRKRVYEDGPLRARFPNTDGDALEAVIVNTAGGIAGGDSHAFDISLGENAALTMTASKWCPSPETSTCSHCMPASMYCLMFSGVVMIPVHQKV